MPAPTPAIAAVLRPAEGGVVAAGVGVEVANKLVVGMIEEAVGDVVTVEKPDIDDVDEVDDALITLVVLDELDVSVGVAALRTENHVLDISGLSMSNSEEGDNGF